MSRLREYQCDARVVVNKARMFFSSSRRHTLVVEGVSDQRLLTNWLNQKFARLENVNGKENVKRVWRQAKKDRFSSIHCLADLDYDLVSNNTPILDSQFVYVSLSDEAPELEIECNDLESVLIRSNAFAKVMAQKSLFSEIGNDNFFNRVHELREKLRIASRNVGGFRAADMCYQMKNGISPIGGNFNITDIFFNVDSMEVDIDSLKTSLLRSSRTGTGAMEEVCEIADGLIKKFDSGWQLCRGHDLTFMLSGFLTEKLGRRVTEREIEESLRMSCELDTLYQTCFGKKLQQIGKSIGASLLVSA